MIWATFRFRSMKLFSSVCSKNQDQKKMFLATSEQITLFIERILYELFFLRICAILEQLNTFKMSSVMHHKISFCVF